ncbi:hypothetical protein FRC09_006565 [Ceratobasidium sp. 395]|nr:hypothetical protein FRC09_006565 [Ceratobasidium sp. 395]
MNGSPSNTQHNLASLKYKPRKLIVCIDGTSNQFSEKNTNVVELYSRIKKDDTQLTYYNSGIGTYARPFWLSYAYIRQVLHGYIDMGIAWNFDQVIVGAYRWLADTYRPGDQIFLFGFSRGAYQVRTLAAMIEVVGLIHPGNQEQIPFAWALYSNQDPGVTQFKQTFCRKSVDLHFVGVWDTVASVGVFRRKLFLLTDKCDHVTHFRHALALDERRVKFIPEHLRYKCDLKTGLPPDGYVQEYEPSPETVAKHVSAKEVWFVGTHSDVGGGNKSNTTLDRGGEPLKWMMEEAQRCGLSVRLHDVKIGVPRAEVIESLTVGWGILEYIIPVSWKTYAPGRSTWTISRRRNPKSSKDSLTTKEDPDRFYPDKDSIGQAELIAHNGAIQAWKTPGTSESTRGQTPPEEGDADRHQWEGDQNWTQMIKLIKEEPKTGKDGENWLSELYLFSRNFVTGPKAIFAYGGPQFLNRLIVKYPDDKRAIEVVQGIVGYTSVLKLLLKQSTSLGNLSFPDVIGRIEDQLSSTVIPRIGLVLRQWAARPQGNANQLGPHSQAAMATTETKEKSYLARFLGIFRPTNTPEILPVDAHWNLDWIPESSRSIELAKILVDLVMELTTFQAVRDIPSVTENLALLTLDLLRYPEDFGNLSEKEADIMEGILNVMMRVCEYEPAKAVFKSKHGASTMVPIFKSSTTYPNLVAAAARVIGVVAQDALCNIELREDDQIFEGLITLAQDGRDLVRNEATTALAVLAENCTWGRQCFTPLDNYWVGVLCDLLTRKLCTKLVLRIFATISNLKFAESSVDCLAELMEDYTNASLAMANVIKNNRFSEAAEKKIAKKAFNLLTYDDERQIRAAASILNEFMNRSKVLDELRQLNVSSALVTLLRSKSASDAVTTEILDLAVQLALKGVNTIQHDLFTSLAQLALEGNIQAILSVLATAAYDNHYHQEIAPNIRQYMSRAVALIGLDNYRLSRQSIEVLTAFQQGHGQNEVSASGALDAVILLIQSACEDTWYRGSGESWDEQAEVVMVAFRMIQTVSINRAAREYLTHTKVFEALSAAGNGTVIVHPKILGALNGLKQYDDLKPAIESVLAQQRSLSEYMKQVDGTWDCESDYWEDGDNIEPDETTSLMRNRS